MDAKLHKEFLVRVYCSTFNHASYIIDALNGFVMQQTIFPYLCVIIDDASTDGEQTVLQNYLNEHFDLHNETISYEKETDEFHLDFSQHKTNKNCYFAVFFLKQNHYSRKISKASYLAEWLDTRYYAICEGDDYWTDPLKLQKQVDYLESHADCTMCFTNAIMRWDDGSGKPDRVFSPELEERDYSGPELTDAWISPTASLVYRGEIIKTDFYRRVYSVQKLKVVGDIPLILTCKHFGIVHALKDVTCVYRRQPNGFMLSSDSNRKIKHGDYRYAIFQVFGKEHLESSVGRALYHYRLGLSYARKEHNWSNWFKLFGRIVYIYLRHPVCALKRILKIFQEKKALQAQSAH